MDVQAESTSTASIDDIYKCESFKDISRCFVTLHTSINSTVIEVNARLDAVEKKVSDIEHSIEYSHEAIQDVQEVTIANLEGKMKDLDNERIKLELWGRKWNLIFRGLPGTIDEQASETERKVRNFMEEHLHIAKQQIEDMHFAAAHRLRSKDTQKRNVMVRFGSLADKDLVLAEARGLEPKCGYSIITDLPPTVARLRGELLYERAQLPPEEKRKTKIISLREAPFVKLVFKK